MKERSAPLLRSILWLCLGWGASGLQPASAQGTWPAAPSASASDARGYGYGDGGDATYPDRGAPTGGVSSGGMQGSGTRGLPSTPVIRQGQDRPQGPGSSYSQQARDRQGWDDGSVDGQQQGSRAERKPLPPNDFQKFVLQNSGHALPLYGSAFFGQGAGGFRPPANPSAPVDYALGPGDEVLVRGWGSVDVDVRAVIDRNGQIYLPRVGAVPLAGVKLSQAEQLITAAVGRYYRDFQLSVTLGQLRGITVYVVGQARRPGAYAMSGVSTLVSALFASGGPNANGSLRHLRIKRGDRQVAELDLYAFLARGDKSGDIKLQDGDTLVIPPAKGWVALMGKVNVPAVYELSGDDTVESILALAGGLPVVADPKRVYLERLDPSRKPARSVENFALDAQTLKTKLRSGDLLTVLPLTTEFGNAVTLRGNVEQPVRLPWREGMRVRDLIPNKAALMSRASVQRQNEVLMTPEEREQAARGFESQDDDAPRRQQRLQHQRTERDGIDTVALSESVGNLVDEVNMEYAVVERVDSAEVSVELLPFNLRNALADTNSPDNLPLKPGDIVTVFSVNDVRIPQAKRQVFVRVEGEVLRPGVYQMKPGEGLRDLVARAGGLTADAYMFGSEFYREEVRRAQIDNLDKTVRRLEGDLQTRLSSSAASISGLSADSAAVAQVRLQAEAAAQKQSLERLRNLKPSGRIMLGMQPEAAVAAALPELPLENQDRLVIPSRPAFVYVLGSVNTEASLIWRDGRTVADYLSLAGMTSGADEDQVFVVRADGSVMSNNGRWFGGVKGSVVMPGDTIVLPEKTDHESAWTTFTRNAKDITQIIYQFSLGAAAIKTLRD